jgi:hypothetical protein
VTTPSWKIQGQYFETCSCDFVCPCILTQMSATPSKGSCTFAMGFQIAKGLFGDASLDGLGFIIIGFTPEEMRKGNWSAGVIVDERAMPEQRDAIVAMATGAAGGPMAALAGMISSFLGVEAAPIRFHKNGARWSVEASTFARIAARPAMGLDPATTDPLQLLNTGHPANSDLSLARATDSEVNVFGITWKDITGRNNGQYAPFSWANA